jgi:hypothetical protein
MQKNDYRLTFEMRHLYQIVGDREFTTAQLPPHLTRKISLWLSQGVIIRIGKRRSGTHKAVYCITTKFVSRIGSAVEPSAEV